MPFIEDGLAAGQPVAVAVPEPNLSLLRDALGGAAGRASSTVRLLDMAEAGRNPGWIIPGVLREFADRHPGRRVRIIGEPIWAARSAAEYPACAQHEALINYAFAGRDAAILCPYDTARLGPRALADAAATHPVLIDSAGRRTSPDYAPDQVIETANEALPVPAAAATLHFTDANLCDVRTFTVGHAEHAALAADRTGELEIAVHELAANTIVHGGGTGTVRLWSADGHLICEVADRGRITDPLAGRRPVPPEVEGGRGILLANRFADLVRVSTGPDGTRIRLYIRLRTG